MSKDSKNPRRAADGLGLPLTFVGLTFGLAIAFGSECFIGANFGAEIDVTFYEVVAVVVPVTLVALVVALAQDRDRYGEITNQYVEIVDVTDADYESIARTRRGMVMRFLSATAAALIAEVAALVAVAADESTTFLFFFRPLGWYGSSFS